MTNELRPITIEPHECPVQHRLVEKASQEDAADDADD